MTFHSESVISNPFVFFILYKIVFGLYGEIGGITSSLQKSSLALFTDTCPQAWDLTVFCIERLKNLVHFSKLLTLACLNDTKYPYHTTGFETETSCTVVQCSSAHDHRVCVFYVSL